MVLFKLTRPFITNSKKKDVLFIIGDRNEKVGNQEIPEVTGKFGFGEKMKQVKANRVLKENTLVIENTLFHNTTDNSICTSPGGQYQKEIDYILCS